MVRTLSIILMLIMALCICTSAKADEPSAPDIQVALTRQGAVWVAEYNFAHGSPVWYFRRTKNSVRGAEWRSISFNVETPGVHLARIGHYDALFRADGVPISNVRVRITPYSEPLSQEYMPVITFSDEGLAFYTSDFLVSPKATLAEVAVLPSEVQDGPMPAVLKFRDPGHSILLNGHVSKDTGETPITDNGTYIYTGMGAVEETPAFSRVLDPHLPGWVRDDLDAFLPKLMDLYSMHLGALKGHKPMALVAWGGSARDGRSQNGSVLEGMVVMALSGKSLESPNTQIRDDLRWFFGHETSHFWLGQTVTSERGQDAWIFEGGADFLAINAIKRIDLNYDAEARWQEELDECLAMNGAGKTLGTAEERGDVRAIYGCGALLNLSASSAAQRHDAKADDLIFVRRLLEENRASGKLSAEKWLTAFSKDAGDQAMKEIKSFLDGGTADPVAFWTRLFTVTGVPFHMEGTSLKFGRVSN